MGVISTHILKSCSGGGRDPLHERVAEKTVHEIGYVTDFNHRSKTSSDMHFSQGLSNTDLKSLDICENSGAHLRATIDKRIQSQTGTVAAGNPSDSACRCTDLFTASL
jgi:predicted Zn-dependent protease